MYLYMYMVHEVQSPNCNLLFLKLKLTIERCNYVLDPVNIREKREKFRLLVINDDKTYKTLSSYNSVSQAYHVKINFSIV